MNEKEKIINFLETNDKYFGILFSFSDDMVSRAEFACHLNSLHLSLALNYIKLKIIPELETRLFKLYKTKDNT